MTALAPPAPPDVPPQARVRRTAWLRPVWAGIALLLAGSPVGAVVQGTSWWGYAAGAVALVVAVGLLVAAVRPRGVVAVVVAQFAALAVLLTGLFTGSGVLRIVPGPAAVGELTALVSDAATQIRTEAAPVPATPAMLLLVTLAFGVTAVAVHAVTVGARAPAAVGVLLLAVFAVPAALADDLLPAWMPAAGAAGFGLLLLARPGPPSDHRQWRPGAGAAGIVAAAVVLALAAGAAAGAVGTAGRFPSTGGVGASRVGEIGLSPFTALRGELLQSTPSELFRVTGLPRPTYLRALTLSTYVPDAGWQVRRPGPGIPLTGPLPGSDVAGDRASVDIENVGFRDYWLPVYGVPLGVAGPDADLWSYDALSGTAYSNRPQQEGSWTQETLLPTPTADALRAADGANGVDPLFLNTDGVDRRVAAIAREITADAPTGFDRAVALNQWFTGPDSTFTYDLSTAPGNGDDALVEFLTIGKRGYCEQFASAMAVMLRTVGVPARVAVGFTGGREADDGRSVSTADAHAWVEAWFPGAGWTTFDPTPLNDGRAIVPPYVAEAAGETGDSSDDQPAESAAPPPPAPEETAAPEAGAPETATDSADGAPAPGEAAPSGSPLPLVLALLTLLVAAAAAPAWWRARMRRRRLTAADAGGADAAEAAWTELLAESADHGVPGRATDTVRTAADRMVQAHGLDAGARRALNAVTGIVEESWYGGVDPAPGDLAGPTRTVSTALRAVPLPLHRRVFPASVVDRRPGRTDRNAADQDADDRDNDDTAVTRH
ncbi:MAG TPA: transglutaminaseTgpA domain-containing protein [Pseudonocardia sp.]|nr:transglutaminaseTgpA domain-containing protein [Pseudonocardia sp.]